MERNTQRRDKQRVKMEGCDETHFSANIRVLLKQTDLPGSISPHSSVLSLLHPAFSLTPCEKALM